MKTLGEILKDQERRADLRSNAGARAIGILSSLLAMEVVPASHVKLVTETIKQFDDNMKISESK